MSGYSPVQNTVTDAVTTEAQKQVSKEDDVKDTGSGAIPLAAQQKISKVPFFLFLFLSLSLSLSLSDLSLSLSLIYSVCKPRNPHSLHLYAY